jgi:hypothetical protein
MKAPRAIVIKEEGSSLRRNAVLSAIRWATLLVNV